MPSKGRNKPPFVAGLDSATYALHALACTLHGGDFQPLRGPGPLAPVAPLVFDHAPIRLIDLVYSWAGWIGGIPAGALAEVDSERVARGVVDTYPKRRYPAVLVGATNGAAVHLAAALGVPWLPQTLLIGVRRHHDPDDPRGDLEWGRRHVEPLVHRNPDWRIYQASDANQDRRMLRHMAYLRAKRLTLGAAYERFLHETLEPGGTILTVECHLRHPSTRVSDRHVFQFGGRGGITTAEYLEGGPRVRRMLERAGSSRKKWDPPEPTGNHPEAEWGFDDELRRDIDAFAQRHGYRVRSLTFDDPQELSPSVAEMHRCWYRRMARPDDRLYLESFIHLHPHIALTGALVPYWCVFNGTPSLQGARAYLERADPFGLILAGMFSNSMEGVGIASVDEWRSLLGYARREGRFLGVRPKRYPRDVASFLRHGRELRKYDLGLPRPAPLDLDRALGWLEQARARIGAPLGVAGGSPNGSRHGSED